MIFGPFAPDKKSLVGPALWCRRFPKSFVCNKFSLMARAPEHFGQSTHHAWPDAACAGILLVENRLAPGLGGRKQPQSRKANEAVMAQIVTIRVFCGS